MLKKKGGGQIMSENSKHNNTNKKCKKQGKTPKYVGENLILKSGHKNKKRGGRVKYVGEH